MFQLPSDFATIKRHLVRVSTVAPSLRALNNLNLTLLQLKYETVVGTTSLPHLHHWLLIECDPAYEAVYLRNQTSPAPGLCSAPAWQLAQQHCQKISLAWATGGDLVVDMPSDKGYPLGGSATETKHFFLQVHYEKPAEQRGVSVQNGVRLYVTKRLRPVEFGILTVASDAHPLAISIPPRMTALSVETLCPSEFMNAFYTPAGNITVFASLPHTHLAGRSVLSKVVRDGKEVEFIARNQFYDSAYQYVNYLARPVLLQRNDAIVLSCVYNTMDREGFTVGGPGTRDEMWQVKERLRAGFKGCCR